MSAGVMKRGGHCLKVWAKKQHVVSLSSAESELYAAVKTASEGLGIQCLAKDLVIVCTLNLHLDASATMCLVNRRRFGKAKHVSVQHLWTQEASKSVRHQESGHACEPRVDDETVASKFEQLMKLMGYRCVERCAVQRAEGSLIVVSLPLVTASNVTRANVR